MPKRSNANRCAGARALVIVSLVFAPLVLSACAGDETMAVAAEESAALSEGRPYTVELAGVEDPELAELLRASGLMFTLQDRPPASAAGLARRVDGDLERFRAVLRSEGHYDADVGYWMGDAAEVGEVPAIADGTPSLVTMMIVPGPAYTLESYRLEPAEGADPTPLSAVNPRALGAEMGVPARAGEIVAVEERVLQRLANSGRPLARQVDRTVTVDHGRRAVDVRVVIDPGPPARFGVLTIKGLDNVKEDYARRLVPWRRGESFDRSKVDALRARWLATGLFDSVILKTADETDADGEMAVTATVAEAASRSLGAGAAVSSSEGPSAHVFWEHRNLLGRDEDLRVSLTGGLITQALEGAFRKPNYARLGRDLTVGLRLSRTDSDTFEEVGVDSSIGLEWPVGRWWRGSMGLSGEFSDVTDQDSTVQTVLFGLPVAYWLDTTDNVLDPTKGGRLRIGVTPYGGWADDSVAFLVSRVGGSAYAALDDARRYIIAGRARIGSLVGATREAVPANKRFYAGGGGSIRGYSFQAVGSLDDEEDPVGGRSLIEVGAELRLRVFDDFGLVPFVEGGNVFDRAFPDFSDELQWAAGLGGRYYTTIGPLRLDVGFPINPRDGIDDRFEFYVSLGQAF